MFSFLKECFSINLNDYENIKFNLEINKVIFGSAVALIVGIVLLGIYRSNIRMVVLQLLRHGANSEESSKSLADIGLEKSFVIKYLLLGKGILTKTVARVGERVYSYDEYITLSKEEKAKNEKVDFDTAKFYIREDGTDMASAIIEKYATSVPRIVFASVFVALICMCVISCMPAILNIVNKLFGSVKM